MTPSEIEDREYWHQHWIRYGRSDLSGMGFRLVFWLVVIGIVVAVAW